MICRQWVLPGVGWAAALRGGWGSPDEGMELRSVPLGHPWGLATGDRRAGAKQGLIAVRGRVVDEPGKGKRNAVSPQILTLHLAILLMTLT